ncbi:VCBS repeat-containing protein, partial [Mesorhizobium shonense]
VANGFNFTAEQRDALFATSSIETIVDASGTYSVLPPAINHPPVVQNVLLSATEDGLAVSGAFAGDDPDAADDPSTLHYTITSHPTEGSVVNNNDGTFSFNPGSAFQDLAEGATRQVAFNYAATDSHGAVSNTGTVTVTVTGTNDVPVIGGVSSGAVTEDVAVDASSHLNASGALTIADVDQGQSSFAAQAGVAGSNGFGTFTLAADGSWTYSADNTQTAIQQLGAGQSLTDSFTAVSSDGTASQLVTVTIHGTNDVPTLAIPSAQSTTTDSGIGITGIIVTDPDAGDTFTVTLATTGGLGAYLTALGKSFGSQYGQVVGSGTPEVVVTGTLAEVNASLQTLGYGPYQATPGDDIISITVTDAAGASASGQIPVTITPVANTAPVVQNVLLSATEDGLAVTGAFSGDDPDADDDPSTLHYTITSQPTEGSVVNNNDGTFSFNPGSGFQDLA